MRGVTQFAVQPEFTGGSRFVASCELRLRSNLSYPARLARRVRVDIGHSRRVDLECIPGRCAAVLLSRGCLRLPLWMKVLTYGRCFSVFAVARKVLSDEL